jgi:hypothetical protein
VVFARRRLEDTSFAQNLDRYWIDWVSILTFSFSLLLVF